MEIKKIDKALCRTLDEEHRLLQAGKLKEQELLEYGYMIEAGEEKIGSFQLHPTDEHSVQLRKLSLFNEATPELLLFIFHEILVFIHTTEVDQVIVSSHTRFLDELLEHYGFEKNDGSKNQAPSTHKSWVYKISNNSNPQE
ncbi:hypothetical protein [Thalassobacillus hwangdonensis]